MLAAKVAAAVLIVVTASRATERAGPRLGSMIATLPVSAGPVYVFLALDHGAAADSLVCHVRSPSRVGFSGVRWPSDRTRHLYCHLACSIRHNYLARRRMSEGASHRPG